MVARYSAASLGLLAFSISVIAGLLVQNPVSVTLSRSILALLVFCIIGLLLGGAAQMVIAEHERSRGSSIRKRYEADSAGNSNPGGNSRSDGGTGEKEPFAKAGGSVAA